MTRREFMDLCSIVAQYPEQIQAKEIPERYQVVYEGIHYYPIGYEVRFDRYGDPFEVAVLHDLKASSITKGELKNVEKLEEQDEAD